MNNQYAIFTTLGLYCVFGITGNVIVLVAFKKCKKLPIKSVFIQMMSWVDFITCLVAIPMTIAMEASEFVVSSDVICKLYHFLVTAIVTLSVMIMAAIATERYTSICRAQKKKPSRCYIRTVIAVLCFIAFTIGLLECFQHKMIVVNEKNRVNFANSFNTSNDIIENNDTQSILDFLESFLENKTLNVLDPENISDNEVRRHFGSDHHVTNGLCSGSSDILGTKFANMFEVTRVSIFALCLAFIVIVYILIFVFLKTRKCACNNGDGNNRLRLRRLKNDMKSAVMMSLVVLAFLLSFMPAWLMMLRLIPMNALAFNSYFGYHVLNPFIYMIMNGAVRKEIRILSAGFSLRFRQRIY